MVTCDSLASFLPMCIICSRLLSLYLAFWFSLVGMWAKVFLNLSRSSRDMVVISLLGWKNLNNILPTIFTRSIVLLDHFWLTLVLAVKFSNAVFSVMISLLSTFLWLGEHGTISYSWTASSFKLPTAKLLSPTFMRLPIRWLLADSICSTLLSSPFVFTSLKGVLSPYCCSAVAIMACEKFLARLLISSFLRGSPFASSRALMLSWKLSIPVGSNL